MMVFVKPSYIELCQAKQIFLYAMPFGTATFIWSFQTTYVLTSTCNLYERLEQLCHTFTRLILPNNLRSPCKGE